MFCLLPIQLSYLHWMADRDGIRPSCELDIVFDTRTHADTRKKLPQEIDTNGSPPLSSVQTAYAALLKSADQVSPFVLSKMPVSVTLVIAALIFGAHGFGFFYQIVQYYHYCSVDNNCVTCSLSLSQDPNAICQRLASTELNINGGCVSIPMENNFSIIEDIVRNIDLKVDELKESLDSVLFTSLKRHGGVIQLLKSNSNNQLVDPDPQKAREFLSRNFFGFSDRFAGKYALNVSDQSAVAAALKVLFSYISIGCVISSSEEISTFSRDILTDRDEQGYYSLGYTSFALCGCRLQCPSNLTEVSGSIDISALDLQQNGLGSVLLSLPNSYVQCSSPADADDSGDCIFRDHSAVGELTYEEPDHLPNSSTVMRHCPASVLTSTPSTLNGLIYECCKPMTNIEKLAQASAFGSLCMTFGVLGSTLLFLPCFFWSQDLKLVLSDLKERLSQ